MAVVRIPDDLLERTIPQLRDRRKRLGYRIASGARNGKRRGTIDADRRRLSDLDEFTDLLEEAAERR